MIEQKEKRVFETVSLKKMMKGEIEVPENLQWIKNLPTLSSDESQEYFKHPKYDVRFIKDDGGAIFDFELERYYPNEDKLISKLSTWIWDKITKPEVKAPEIEDNLLQAILKDEHLNMSFYETVKAVFDERIEYAERELDMEIEYLEPDGGDFPEFVGRAYNLKMPEYYSEDIRLVEGIFNWLIDEFNERHGRSSHDYGPSIQYDRAGYGKIKVAYSVFCQSCGSPRWAEHLEDMLKSREAYFRIYTDKTANIPGHGRCSLVIDEILRACDRILYRWFNDGDIGIGFDDGNFWDDINLWGMINDLPKYPRDEDRDWNRLITMIANVMMDFDIWDRLNNADRMALQDKDLYPIMNMLNEGKTIDEISEVIGYKITTEKLSNYGHAHPYHGGPQAYQYIMRYTQEDTNEYLTPDALCGVEFPPLSALVVMVAIHKILIEDERKINPDYKFGDPLTLNKRTFYCIDNRIDSRGKVTRYIY